jgi:hypothetical protein
MALRNIRRGTLDQAGAPPQVARYDGGFMRPPARAALAIAVAMVAMACGSRSRTAETPGDDAGDEAATDSGTGPLDSPATGDDAAAETGFLGDGSTVSNCDPAAALVYVATEEKQLYSFDPQHNVFTLLALIDCANGSYVNSMAVDRNAVAWINYGDGSLWKVDINKPSCVATGFVPNQGGVGLFGMGFSAKVPGGNAETLFIDDLMGGGLGFINLSTMMLERFGPFTGDLADRSAELTGTGDARLYGFFAGSFLGDAGSASVTEIDPNSEAPITQYPLPTVDTGSDWAFSFWGGDFYLYTADKYDMNNPDTVVTRFRPSDGSVTVIDPSLNFRIVGAGSSTCAPTTPPQ